MAIKKSDLYSSLWASCDELRGGMDASQYKDYILVLLFVKYVSDKYANAGEYAEFIIPEGGSFKDLIALKGTKEIGDGINTVIKKLAEENGLVGIIDVADFNDDGKLGKDKEMIDKLSKLIGIFETKLDFSKNKANGDDLLGDAYEYLMMNFATQSGKSKGQFYTPSEVSQVLSKVIGIDKAQTSATTVYDPTCGSGSLLIKASDESGIKGGLTIYGQEKDISTTALAKMNMILHGFATADIADGGYSTLSSPQFKDGDNLKTFDYIVANPPFSIKSWTNGFNTDEQTKKLVDDFGRFTGFGIPPEKNGDYAFLLHIVKSLKSTGTAAVILPHGVLFRGNAEGEIREEIVKRKLIKGIIGLPANLFYGTGIPACILVIDKHGANSRDSIFMVDASKDFVKDGNKNRLRAQDTHKIVDTFTKGVELKGYSRKVPLSEIQDSKNDYNLNLPRYIDSNDAEDLHDLAGHLQGGIPVSDIDALDNYWSVFKDAREKLFKNNSRDGYVDPKVSYNEISTVIRESENYAEYYEQVHNVYNNWVSKNKTKLEGLQIDDKPKDIIAELSEDLLESFKGFKLIENYNIYQYLMTYWEETMQDDLYQIVTDGWLKASSPRQIEKQKDKKNNLKWLEEGDFKFGKSKAEIRYVTDLIPPVLIINNYFAELQIEINDIESQKEALNQELTELIENNSGDNDLLTDVKNDSDNITKKSVEDRIKVLNKDKKQGLSIDSDELAELNKAKTILVAIAEFDKELKAKTEELQNKAFTKYKDLTESDIKDIVVNDKWLATMQSNIDQELDKMAQRLTNRVKELTERYESTLPQLEDKVEDYAEKVKQHLAKMGLTY